MSQQANEVRIIGGIFKGRKLKFPALKEIRPTPNRIRETLFNWLSPVIVSADCLDLFAGSGALGFESLSRGAQSVIFCEKSRVIVQYLKTQIEKFHIENAHVYHTIIPNPALYFHQTFDIVFIDPPFHQNLIESTTHWLMTQRILKKRAYIYIETDTALKTLPVPTHWQIVKQKIAGEVAYRLYLSDTTEITEVE